MIEPIMTDDQFVTYSLNKRPTAKIVYRLLLLSLGICLPFSHLCFSDALDRPRVSNIVDSFAVAIPAPSGICSDGKSFWIPNYSAFQGERRIYKVDIRTHQITSAFPSPYAWPTGMAWDGVNLWVMDGYPLHEYSLIKMSPSGQILQYFSAVYSCYWAGVAWDGSYIYYGTNICWASPPGRVSMIYKVNPRNGAILDSLAPPSGNINGLVFDGGFFWYCDLARRLIYKITKEGIILRSFPTPGPEPSGLVITQGYLWNVDFQTKQVYQINIGLAPSIPRNLSAEGLDKHVRLTWDPNSDDDLEQYRIYRNTSEDPLGARCIDSIGSRESSYVDQYLINHQAYYYWLTAVDSDGYESHVSKSVSAIPVDRVPPPIPFDVAASGDSGNVHLHWSANPIADLYYFKIYRNRLPDSPTKVFIDSVFTPAHIYVDSRFATSSVYYYWVSACDSSGNESGLSGPVAANPILPVQAALHQNYPNPFNSGTTIAYDVSQPTYGYVGIYNTIGQLVKLYPIRHETIGYFSVLWDGTNEEGLPVHSGSYIVTLKTNNYLQSKKILLMK